MLIITVLLFSNVWFKRKIRMFRIYNIILVDTRMQLFLLNLINNKNKCIIIDKWLDKWYHIYIRFLDSFNMKHDYLCFDVIAIIP